ncbi:PREDICTED: SID1 transmembrane family member 2-like isoform X3 [Branchiostoma belcheri]|uniref:SID1 transmembrane family member 2-like isoform X3 n=1 Tax=Branchiostoma belcheri TaxID=7741 RepID=A0A6P4ZME1_BRABE|nr:PREDICTED: SID1 transmembrane family member 2-like isoform X3 [Branchiostoma belcheri]
MATFVVLVAAILTAISTVETSGGVSSGARPARVRRQTGELRQEIPAEFTQIYQGSVFNGTEDIYRYTYMQNESSPRAIRVEVKSEGATEDYPLLFVVRQQRGILSWQVPLMIRGIYGYDKVSRTLCPMDHLQVGVKDEKETVYLEVSAASPTALNYRVNATILTDFILSTGQPRNFLVSPSQPQYYAYKMPPDLDMVVVKVSSPNSLCAVFSLQPIKCPVYDLDRNIEFVGIYQTFMKKAAITVQRSYFPNGEFYVVVVVKATDADCTGEMETIQPAYPSEEAFEMRRVKEVNVVVGPSITDSQYVTAVFVGILVFVLFYVVTFMVLFIQWIRQRNAELEGLAPRPEEQGYAGIAASNAEAPINAQRTEPNYGATGWDRVKMPSVLDTAFTDGLSLNHITILGKKLSNNGSVSSQKEANISPNKPTTDPYTMGEQPAETKPGIPPTDQPNGPPIPPNPPPPRPAQPKSYPKPPMVHTLSDSSMEDDIDMLDDADEDKDIYRTKTFLYVADLARKDHRHLSQKYNLYSWNLLTISVFYALPVIQLVITYQKMLNTTGNEDICYYNFFCAQPAGDLTAFNNVYSNIGYIMLGVLILILVYRRDYTHQKKVDAGDRYAIDYGIPKHFGLFYAIGIALVMEGVMSGCYHVCPNYSNFQFDTSFMYIIGGLGMLKLYQTRHPDINANAYAAYASLAIVIFVAVIGVVFGTPYFWAIFTIVYVLAILALTAQVYYMGRWRLDMGIFHRMYLLIRTDCLQCSKPMYWDRFVLLLVGNIINWSLALFGAVAQPDDFASFMLAIFIINFLLYFVFYIVMKLRSGERILWVTVGLIIITLICWTLALSFFFKGVTTWEKTPAQSRLDNKDCVLMGFYDDHDIWHFMSAISMFCSFLVLLMLDDDLDYTPRDKIPVF